MEHFDFNKSDYQTTTKKSGINHLKYEDYKILNKKHHVKRNVRNQVTTSHIT